MIFDEVKAYVVLLRDLGYSHTVTMFAFQALIIANTFVYSVSSSVSKNKKGPVSHLFSSLTVLASEMKK